MEEIKREIKKILLTSDNEKLTIQYLWFVAKAVLREVYSNTNIQKMGIEGTYLNIVKAIYDKTDNKHYSHW